MIPERPGIRFAKPPSKRVPENPIIQVASKALEKFVVKAFGELEAKLPQTLQPGSDGERPNWQLRLLTDFMIRQLRESVSRALGTTTAGDTRGRGLERDALRAPAAGAPQARARAAAMITDGGQAQSAKPGAGATPGVGAAETAPPSHCRRAAGAFVRSGVHPAGSGARRVLGAAGRDPQGRGRSACGCRGADPGGAGKASKQGRAELPVRRQRPERARRRH